MTTIPEKIDEILDKRLGRGAQTGNGHIDMVRARIQEMNKVKGIITDYQNLRDSMLSEIEEKSGEYYAMSVENPEFAGALEAASPEECLRAVDKAINELELLDKRFSRETINISVIGRARQGKSRLLQAISGLRNEVIPASDGSDCTGAKSVICNDPSRREATAKVTFYTDYELVAQVQLYLKELGIPVNLGSASQIPLLKTRLEEYATDLSRKSAKEQSLFGHLKKYVDHFEEYHDLLGSEIDTDENHIRDYVAQYDSQGNDTFKFLGVKEVRIYTKFNYSDAGKIVLVDTIGLGDTALGIREKMISTLRNDSDAAILVRLPADTGDHISKEDDELYDFIRDSMGEETLGKWLFAALNVGPGLGRAGNFKSGDKMEEAYKNRKLNFADIKKVDCSDKEEVQAKLMLPVLEYLAQNLDAVDQGLMEKANKVLESAYNKYFMLCQKAGAVMDGTIRAALSSGGLFDDLYEKLELKRRLYELNQRYSQPEMESNEIREEVMRILEEIPAYCPTVEEIATRLTEGGPDSYVDNVYNHYADNLRAAMRDELDNVNSTVITALQDGVKVEIINILREDDGGRMGRIPLMDGKGAAPFEWLASLIEQRTEEFPMVSSAMEDILTYRLNIEGLLEYKANLALEHLEQGAGKFTRLPDAVYKVPPQEQAEIILQTLMTSIPDVARDLMEGIRELLKIPANSFNARIRKFRERLFFRDEGKRELKNFYREYATSIWSDAFGAMTRKQVTLKGWNEILEKLNDENSKDLFVLSLN